MNTGELDIEISGTLINIALIALGVFLFVCVVSLIAQGLRMVALFLLVLTVAFVLWAMLR